MNECRINPCCQSLSSFKVMDVLERACALEKEGRDIVHLQIGEPDFDTPECVKDAACKAIHEPARLADDLKLITGVVEHGLFLDLADEAIVGTDAGVEMMVP